MDAAAERRAGQIVETILKTQHGGFVPQAGKPAFAGQGQGQGLPQQMGQGGGRRKRRRRGRGRNGSPQPANGFHPAAPAGQILAADAAAAQTPGAPVLASTVAAPRPTPVQAPPAAQAEPQRARPHPQKPEQHSRRRDADSTSVAPQLPPSNVRKVVLLNATEPGEIRVAIMESGELAEIFMERKSRGQQAGNIYKGRVVNVEPSLQAAFVDLGVARNGFLHASDCIPPNGGYKEILSLPAPRRAQPQQQPQAQAQAQEQEQVQAAPEASEQAVQVEPAREKSVAVEPVASREQAVSEAPAEAVPQSVQASTPEAAAFPSAEQYAGPLNADISAHILSSPALPTVPLPAQGQGAAAAQNNPNRDRRHGRHRWRHGRGRSGRGRLPGPAPMLPPSGSSGAASSGTGVPPPPPVVSQESVSSEPQSAEPPVQPVQPVQPRSEPARAPEYEDAQDDVPVSAHSGENLSETVTPSDDSVVEHNPAGGEEPVEHAPDTADESGAASGSETEFAEYSDDNDGAQDGEQNREQDGDWERQETEGEGEPSGADEQPASEHTAVPIPAPGQPAPVMTPRPKRNGGGGRSGRERPHDRRYTVQEMLKEGQEVLVQVVKEGIGQKGPALTTYLSMPGRYLVLMPAVQRLGVSKRIENEEQRRALKDALNQLNPPEDMGVIVRTAGTGKGKEELQRDMDYLMRAWDGLKKKANSVKAPALIYQEGDVVTRVFRDVITTDVAEIVIDDPVVLERAREFLRETDPASERKLKLYSETEPIFHKYGVEQQLQRLFNRKVNLRSGGSIVIEQTEALVAIDVNTGRFREKRNQDDTILQTNLEAAREVARQLRLRDIGGLVMIDFIDMEIHEHRRRVERELKAHLARDKARINVLPISTLGMVEMTRQRIRHSLRKTLFDRCPHCSGSGQIKSPESLGLEMLREIRSQLKDSGVRRVKVLLNSGAAYEILNQFRKDLVRMEEARGVAIEVRGDPGVPVSQIQVSTAKEGGEWVLKKVSEVDDYVRNS